MATKTLAQNIAQAISDFSAIKGAIEYMGVTVESGTPTSEYADCIKSIEGGSSSSPQLNAPTLTRSNDTITISNPSSNGSFVESYDVYDDDSVIKQQTGSTFSLIGLGAGDYELTVKAKGSGFTDSAKSNKIRASVFSISKQLSNLTANDSATLISNGLSYTVTLSPTSGYYLPEDIVVTMGGTPAKFEYNSYTGVITIAAVTGNIVITAAAYAAPKLRRPTLSIENGVLTVTPPLYAEHTITKVDGVTIGEYPEN